MKPSYFVTATLLWLGASSVWAQAPGSEHAAHGASSGAPAMATQTGASASGSGTSMDHGSMNTQGGPTPDDARDPHAYANGLTLESGPYVLPGPRQLRLSDEHSFGSVLLDRLERAYTTQDTATAYEAQAWFGGTYDRLVVKAEGDIAQGKVENARTEVLWSHAIASFWDTQLGLRQDSGTGPDRTWLALGIQGLAPYWFELDAAAYIDGSGRTALRLSGAYELLLTQRLILQPRVHVNLYDRADEARKLGGGLADAAAGIRLRYEFSRQFAPYIGVEWAEKFGQTADLARAEGQRTGETRYVAGVRMWF